jgi:hypothetical protein
MLQKGIITHRDVPQRYFITQLWTVVEGDFDIFRCQDHKLRIDLSLYFESGQV